MTHQSSDLACIPGVDPLPCAGSDASIDQRGGGVAPHQAHNLEHAGSSPAPASIAILIHRLIERQEHYPLPRFDRYPTRICA